MNKKIRILVWFLLFTIFISGLLLTKQAFSAEQDFKTLYHEYNNIFRKMLIKKIQLTIWHNMPVVLYLKGGSEVRGIYKGYSKYDDSIWIKEYTHWLETGYGIDELQDISVDVKEPI